MSKEDDKLEKINVDGEFFTKDEIEEYHPFTLDLDRNGDRFITVRGGDIKEIVIGEKQIYEAISSYLDIHYNHYKS
ncbi:hypothetical protein QVZ41_14025 [Wenyingzhuangia sp. chi5]|uniref:Uncharacterized protein n=1 Tax=Wenyingzhuangia gilva TaxID=3057677 RepID=A0ABT8VVL0_9FLAO|nr:hypothetical protein [Wenyingzhuangia sp. chi5]MDO3695965.1 hypothetical protein [Wenyingzhuangia sp. chi5]